MRLIGTANVNQLMHHAAERQEVGQKEVATDLPLNDSTGHREKQVQLAQPHQHDLVELKANVRWTEQSNPQTMEPEVSLHLWQLHEMLTVRLATWYKAPHLNLGLFPSAEDH